MQDPYAFCLNNYRRGRPVKKKLAEPVSSDEDEDMITPDIKRPKTASLTAQARPVEVSALNKATQARAFTDRAASTPNINRCRFCDNLVNI